MSKPNWVYYQHVKSPYQVGFCYVPMVVDIYFDHMLLEMVIVFDKGYGRIVVKEWDLQYNASLIREILRPHKVAIFEHKHLHRGHRHGMMHILTNVN